MRNPEPKNLRASMVIVIIAGLFLFSGFAFGQTSFLLSDFNEGDESTPLILNLVPVFENMGVDLYIAGHYHAYERSYKDGVYYLTSAGGGASLHSVGWGDYTEFNSKIFHHCLVDVGTTSITVTAYDNAGNAFDNFVLPKSATPSPPSPSSPEPLSGPPTGLTVYPYLQDVTQTSIKVMWITEVPLPSRVDCGLTGAYGNVETNPSPVTVHEITLTGLSPNTTYHYKVTSDTLTSDDNTFKTAPSSNSGFTFISYGDNRSDDIGAVYQYDHEMVCNSIAGHNPETMVLHTGDFCLIGTEDEWKPQFFHPARDILKNNVLYTAIGNHTYENKERYEAYFEPPEGSGSGTELYYSFNYGNTHFVILDTMQDCTEGSDQYNWLVADLSSPAATSATWIIVAGHTPIYQSQSRSAPNGFGGDTGPFRKSGDGSYCHISYEYNPAIVLDGAGLSLRLDYNVPLAGSYSGLWTKLEGADLSSYDAVSLWVKGASGGEEFLVGLMDSFENESKVPITDYLTGGVSTTWQKVTIPLSVFTSIQHWDDMENLSITFLNHIDSEGRIYIDNIQFEGIAGTPTPALMVDNYNDGNSGRNSLGFWTGGGGPIVTSVEEPLLHKYLEDKTNNAKKITYDCNLGAWGFYSSNLWDGDDILSATDATEFEYLSFRVKGEQGGEEFYIAFQYGVPIAPGDYRPETPKRHSSDFFTLTTEWQQVNVLLSAFPSLDKTKMRAIVVIFDSGLSVKQGPIYFDNLQLSKGYEGYGKPESTGPVKIDRDTKMLLVGGRGYEQFTIKGVGYQPTPIGAKPPPSPPHPDDPDIYDRDFQLLEKMGCNTIRIWALPPSPWVEVPGDPYINLMNKAAEYGLKVIAGFWMDTHVEYADLEVREKARQGFEEFVDAYKDFPALLMWGIGNENNYRNGSNKAYYSLCNELAEIAYQREGASYHPVMIINGNLFNIGVEERGAEDFQLNYLDAWGSNAYYRNFYDIYWYGDHRYRRLERPDDGFFEVYKEKSSKPLVITEYGADAYRTEGIDPIVGIEDEDSRDAQADWVRQNTLDIMDASEVCLGGHVMAYSDEWWKDKYGNRWIHDPGPAAHWGDNLPDGYANEEYWGIVSISDNGGEPDIVTPRKVYDTLKLLYEGAKVVKPDESIQTAIDNSSSGDTIYVIDGTFVEDISIKDKDDIALVGDGAEDTVIKGNISLEDSGSSVERFSIYYKNGGTLIYSNDHYTDLELLKDAGVTVVDSEITVKDCIIMPDPGIFTTNYGKGIQVWNMYVSSDISPTIENNLIIDAQTGICLFSQAFGGAILGKIKNTTIVSSDIGILMRMRRENPLIQDNILSGLSHSGIHITYEDGALLDGRIANITGNDFFNNNYNVWCDEIEQELTPLPEGTTELQGNLYVDPQFDGRYIPQNPACEGKGYSLP